MGSTFSLLLRSDSIERHLIDGSSSLPKPRVASSSLAGGTDKEGPGASWPFFMCLPPSVGLRFQGSRVTASQDGNGLATDPQTVATARHRDLCLAAQRVVDELARRGEDPELRLQCV